MYLVGMSDVVTLASELLAIESTTGRERDAVDFVSRWCIAHGWTVSLQEVETGRSNLWATRKGGGRWQSANDQGHKGVLPHRP